jgi:hypothetical protein
MDEQTESLKSKLDSGKITPEQYQEMYEKEFVPALSKTIPTKRPWQVWVCAISFFLLSILDIVFIINKHPEQVYAAILDIIFGIALLSGKRWAFILTILFGIFAVIACIFIGDFISFFLNLAIVVILASAWKYYSQLY